MEWDHYDYKIAEHYLSALINGDVSGMDNADEVALSSWQDECHATAHAAGFTIGHWDCDAEDSEDYGRCDVSGLFANRYAVRLMVYKTPQA